jgi:hypothetical protein
MIRAKDISEATRWKMATHVLTRLVIALGQEDESSTDVSSFQERMFSEMAREIRAIADHYNLPRDNAADLVQTLGAISVILFGPEFETRFIEGFPEEAVIRLAECAMFREKSAHDIPPSQVNRACRAYVQHAIEALNPEFSISVTRARCAGDSFCEMIIERRRPETFS